MEKDTFLKKTGFKFCPKCKSADISDAENHMRCHACGYKFYSNCAAAVSGIIIKNRQILLIRRKNDPKKGLLDLPGGFADYGESLEEALVRELIEEIGVAVSSIRYVASYPNTYPFGDVLYHTLDCFFLAEPDSDAPIVAGDDAAEIVWMRPEEINDDMLAFNSVRRVFKHLFNKASL